MEKRFVFFAKAYDRLGVRGVDQAIEKYFGISYPKYEYCKIYIIGMIVFLLYHSFEKNRRKKRIGKND